MWPVIIWTAVVSLALGFVLGAKFRQYRPIKREKTYPNYYWEGD